MLVGSFIAAQHIFGDGGQLLRPGREEIPHELGQKLSELDFQHQLARLQHRQGGQRGVKMSQLPTAARTPMSNVTRTVPASKIQGSRS